MEKLLHQQQELIVELQVQVAKQNSLIAQLMTGENLNTER